MTEARAGLAAVVVGVGLLAGCGMRIPCDSPNVDQRQCAQANATVAAADQEIKSAVDRAARQAVNDAAARAQVEARRQAASWWDQLVAGVLAMLGGASDSRPPVPIPPVPVPPVPVPPLPVPPVAPAPPAASVTNIHFVPQITLGNTIVLDQSGKPLPNRGTTGLENCGPASVAMAIQKYHGPNAVTLEQVAEGMRGRPNSNVLGVNTTTDFRDPRTVAYLRDGYRLGLRNVATLDALRTEIAADHPVLVLVNNALYVRYENRVRVPYPDPPKGGLDGWLANHIVLAVGYDATNVYVEDPLAWPNAGGDHFRIPLDAFRAAADAEADTPGAWHASAVLPGV